MKLNGFRPTHRNKWLFLKEDKISSQALLLLEFYADMMDFDHRHEQYGTLYVDLKEIGGIFRKSPGAVRVWHNELVEKGFIKKTDKKGIYLVSCHERYVNDGFWKGKAAQYAKEESKQTVEKILQNFGIGFQNSEQNSRFFEQKTVPKIMPPRSKALGSSKVQSIVSGELDYQTKEPSDGLTNEDKLFLESNEYLCRLSWVKQEDDSQKTVEQMSIQEIRTALLC